MKLSDFQIMGDESEIGRKLNWSIAYLSERVALELGKTRIDAPFRKVAFSLATGRSSGHGRVKVLPPIAEVSLFVADLAPLFGPEPVRRSTSLAIVKEGIGFLRQAGTWDGVALLELCEAVWASAPPYRFELTRSPLKRGSLQCRAFYVFGPESAQIVIDVEDSTRRCRSIPVRRVEHFEPLDIWFPVQRIRWVKDGLIFVDRAGRTVEVASLEFA